MNYRKPTRKQKELISRIHLNQENWLIAKEDKQYLYIVHRYTDTKRQIPKTI